MRLAVFRMALKACVGKACPDVRTSVLKAVMHGTGDALLHEYHNYSSTRQGQGQVRVRGKGGLRRKSRKAARPAKVQHPGDHSPRTLTGASQQESR